MDDRQAHELNERLDQFERDTNDRLKLLLQEVQRRDRWIIKSIWQFIGSLNLLIVGAGAWFIIERTKAEFWGALGIFVGAVALYIYLHTRLDRMEEDDKNKIERGSLLSSWVWPD